MPFCFLLWRQTCTHMQSLMSEETRKLTLRLCGNQHCFCSCSLPPLLCIYYVSIFNCVTPCYFSVRLLPSVTSVCCAPRMKQGEVLKEALAETGKCIENKETIGRRTFYKLQLNATPENSIPSFSLPNNSYVILEKPCTAAN